MSAALVVDAGDDLIAGGEARLADFDLLRAELALPASAPRAPSRSASQPRRFAWRSSPRPRRARRTRASRRPSPRGGPRRRGRPSPARLSDRAQAPRRPRPRGSASPPRGQARARGGSPRRGGSARCGRQPRGTGRPPRSRRAARDRRRGRASPRRLGVVDQARQGRRVDHPGLVDQQHRALRQAVAVPRARRGRARRAGWRRWSPAGPRQRITFAARQVGAAAAARSPPAPSPPPRRRSRRSCRSPPRRSRRRLPRAR